jgi:hypothetical protein
MHLGKKKTSKKASTKKTAKRSLSKGTRSKARSSREKTPVSTIEHDVFRHTLLKLAEVRMRDPNLPSRPDQEHVAILRQGAKVWNQWRKEFPQVTPNLAHLNIRASFFADLRGVNLIGANLYKAFAQIDLSEADLRKAFLRQANLPFVSLRGAKLTDASLYMARLKRTDLSDATLVGADLRGALLEGTKLTNADISGAKIYGISVWDVNLEGASQSNLIITRGDEPTITVDDLEVAQFIYLLLKNERIRDVLDTITSKVVLILGRFTPERKVVLDALREELRSHNFTPIVFDFDKPASRNLTETVSTLAHMARFVIADLTDAKSIPQELQRIVPDLPSLPVQPVILDSQYEYAMFKDFLDYPWVLLPYRYTDSKSLVSSLEANVIGPAVARSAEIQERRRLIDRELFKR